MIIENFQKYNFLRMQLNTENIVMIEIKPFEINETSALNNL